MRTLIMIQATRVGTLKVQVLNLQIPKHEKVPNAREKSSSVQCTASGHNYYLTFDNTIKETRQKPYKLHLTHLAIQRKNVETKKKDNNLDWWF